MHAYQLTGTEEDEDEVDLPIAAWKQLGKKATSLFRKTPSFEFL